MEQLGAVRFYKAVYLQMRIFSYRRHLVRLPPILAH